MLYYLLKKKMQRIITRLFLNKKNGTTLMRTLSGLDQKHLNDKKYIYNNTLTFNEKITMAWGPAMASSIIPFGLKKHHLNQTPYHLYVHSIMSNHQHVSQKN